MAVARKRLGVWIRLWIVLTILWIVGAGLTMFVMEANNHATHVEAQRELCEFMKEDTNPTAAGADCWAEYAQSMDRFSPLTWANFWTALGVAAVVAAFAWLVGSLGYYAVRWILAGRNITEPVAGNEVAE